MALLSSSRPASAGESGQAPSEPVAAPSSEAAPHPALPLAETLRGPARAEYAAARILYEDGDYSGAFTKLESAYRDSKDARLLWNMAACEKAQRHYASVIVLLERYLVEGAALITDAERQATHDLVETVRGFVNELTLHVLPEGASVWIDGVQVATAPLPAALRVDMGKRRLVVQKAGFVSHETEIDLGGGKSLSLDVALKPEVHEGTLRIVSDPSSVISVDGHVVGTAVWTGPLASGSHSVYISATGKQPHKTEIVIKDHDTSSLQVNLLNETTNLLDASGSKDTTLWWVLGGVALAGASVGTYLLLRPGDAPPEPELGTWGGFEL